MVEKRLFKFIPDERHIHSQMEELIECAGHALLLTAAVVGSWRPRRIIVEDR